MRALALVLALAMPARALAGEEVTPIAKEQPAPFTGLLVPEPRMIDLLQAEIDAEQRAAELAIERDYSKSLDSMYKEKLAEATKPPAFFDRPDVRFWGGFILGGVAVGFAVYGGAKLVQAIGDGPAH